jgi:precorrin-3B methylase
VCKKHKLSLVSLSDLLTPWHVIEKRIEHAAIADFVIMIFNPKSKKRNW